MFGWSKINEIFRRNKEVPRQRPEVLDAESNAIFWGIAGHFKAMELATEDLLPAYRSFDKKLDEKRVTTNDLGEYVEARNRVTRYYRLREHDVDQLLAYCAELCVPEEAKKDQPGDSRP